MNRLNRKAWDGLYHAAAKLVWGAEPVPVLPGFLKLREGTVRMLDAGAGEGRNLPLLLQQSGIQIACCDASASGLLKLKKRFGGKVDITLCDLDHLPYTDQSFDAVLLWDVITTLPDPLPALKEVWRVLAPGGRLVCNMSDCSEEIELDTNGQKESHTGLYQGQYFFRFLDRDRGERLLTEQGFHVVQAATCRWHEQEHPHYRTDAHDHVSHVFSACKPAGDGHGQLVAVQP